MKQISFVLLTFFLLCGSVSVNAQNCDPWIVKAYNEYYKRNPTAAECNIKNYNNGSWSSYEELRGYVRKYAGDPWLFQIYSELYGRKPTDWELNAQLYNKGSWTDYAALKQYVKDYQQSMQKASLSTLTAPYNGNTLVGFFVNGQQVAVNVIAPGGGNVVAAGGGNVVSAGGANVVSAGGANVVAPGGGNIIVNASMAGVRVGDRYSVQAAGTKVIPASGNGALIIR